MSRNWAVPESNLTAIGGCYEIDSRELSVAGAERDVGGARGCTHIGKTPAPGNRAAGEKTVQITASTLNGEALIQNRGHGSRGSWQSVFNTGTAQVGKYRPLHVVRSDSLPLRPLRGPTPAPSLLIDFYQADALVATDGFGFMGVDGESRHGIVLNGQ